MSDIFNEEENEQQENNSNLQSIHVPRLSQTAGQVESENQARNENQDKWKIDAPDGLYETLNYLAQNCTEKDAEQELGRLATAYEYSTRLNVPLEEAYQNVEQYNAAIWGEDKYKENRPENIQAVIGAFRVGYNTVKQNKLGYDLLKAEEYGDTDLAAALNTQIDALEKDNELYQDYNPRNFLLKGAELIANTLPYTLDGIAMSAVGTVAMGNGIPAAFLETSRISIGDVYLTLRKQGNSPEVARKVSTVVGVIQGAAEVCVGDGAEYLISQGMKGAGSVLAKTGAKKISEKIASKFALSNGFKKTLDVLTRYFIDGVGEGAEEAVQEIAAYIGEGVAAVTENLDIPDRNFGEFMKRVTENTVGGIIGGLGLGVPGIIINTKVSLDSINAINNLAKAIPSKELFENIVTDKNENGASLADVIVHKDETDLKEKLSQIYDSHATDRESSIGQIMELNPANEGYEEEVQPVDEEGNETGEEVTQPEAYRTEKNRLYTQDKLISKDEDGTEKHSYRFGNPTKAKKNLYGNIEYTIDEKNRKITINSFEVAGHRESLRQDMYDEFASEYPDMDISWETAGERLNGVKESLIQNNPSGKNNGLNYYADRSNRTDTETRRFATKQITQAYDRVGIDMDADEVATHVALLETIYNSIGKDIKGVNSFSDYIDYTFGEQMFGDASDIESIAEKKGVDARDVGGASINRNIREFNRGAKALIYVSENGDFSTFSHEIAHIARRQLQGNLLAEAENAFGVDQSTHKWTEAQEEAFAYGFEQFLRTGKAKNNALKELFQRLAEFLVRCVNALKPQINMNPEIEDVYNQMLQGDGSVLAQADQEVKTAWEEMYNEKVARDKATIDTDKLTEKQRLYEAPEWVDNLHDEVAALGYTDEDMEEFIVPNYGTLEDMIRHGAWQGSNISAKTMAQAFDAIMKSGQTPTIENVLTKADQIASVKAAALKNGSSESHAEEVAQTLSDDSVSEAEKADTVLKESGESVVEDSDFMQLRMRPDVSDIIHKYGADEKEVVKKVNKHYQEILQNADNTEKDFIGAMKDAVYQTEQEYAKIREENGGNVKDNSNINFQTRYEYKTTTDEEREKLRNDAIAYVQKKWKDNPTEMKRILNNLDNFRYDTVFKPDLHRETGFHNTLIESLLFERDMDALMNKEELADNSWLKIVNEEWKKEHNGEEHPIYKALKNGKQGVIDYLNRKEVGILSSNSKVDFYMSGSIKECNPTLFCAVMCYNFDSSPTNSAQQFSGIAKAELVNYLVNVDPEKAADMAAYEFRDAARAGYLLRVFDKGDGNDQWAKMVNILNDKHGIGTHIFSKKVNFLNQLDKKANVLMLSVDKTNSKYGLLHPEYLKAATIKTIEDIKILDENKGNIGAIFYLHGKNQKVKPDVKQEVEAQGYKEYVCPRDDENKTHTCTDCMYAGIYCHRNANTKRGIEDLRHANTEDIIKEAERQYGMLPMSLKNVVRKYNYRGEEADDIIRAFMSPMGEQYGTLQQRDNPRGVREAIGGVYKWDSIGHDGEINGPNSFTINEGKGLSDDFINLQNEKNQAELIRQMYQDTADWMKAPDGTASLLNREQWLNVRTPNFKEFFGDWENDPKNASKIVSMNKEPKVMYHQTTNDFTVFDTNKVGAGVSDYGTPTGIFLKPNSNNIGIKGSTQMPLFVNIVHPEYFMDREQLGNTVKNNSPEYAKLLDKYHKLDKSYEEKYNKLEAEEDAQFDKLYEIKDQLSDEEWEKRTTAIMEGTGKVLEEWESVTNELASQMKKVMTDYFTDRNVDGIVLLDDEGSFGRKVQTTIAFKPNQLKSATDNNGDFDADNDDIRFQKITDPEELGKALYTINKEAKKYRNIKRDLYDTFKGANYTEDLVKEVKTIIPGISYNDDEFGVYSQYDDWLTLKNIDEKISDAEKELEYSQENEDEEDQDFQQEVLNDYENAKEKLYKLNKLMSNFKDKENYLYKLKDRVLTKLQLNPVDYHIFENGDIHPMYEYAGYKFHGDATSEVPEGYELKELSEISAENKLEAPIDIESAINIVNDFLNNGAEILERINFQTQSELLRDALQYESWQDFMDSYEMERTFDLEDRYNQVPSDADAQWYQSVWETAHGYQTEESLNEKAVQEKNERDGMLPPALDAMFTSSLATDPQMLDDFLLRIKEIDEIDLDGEDWKQVSDEEDVQERENIRKLQDFVSTQASHPLLTNNATRLQNGDELTDTARRKILTLIRGNPRAYRALYAEIMNDPSYAVAEEDTVAEQLKKQHPKYYELVSPNEDLKTMSPEKIRQLSDELSNREVAAKIRQGTMPMDDTLDKYIKSLTKQITDMKKHYKDLEEETQADYNSISYAETKALLKLHERLLVAKSQYEKKNDSITRKIEKGLKVSGKYQRDSQNLKANYDALFRKFTDLKNTIELTTQVEDALARQEKINTTRGDIGKLEEEKSIVQQVQNMRKNLVKQTMRRVPFNRIDYDYAKQLIAIQRMFEPNLIGGVNQWIGPEDTFVRGVISNLLTNSDEMEKMKRYLNNHAKGSQAYAEFMEKFNSLHTIDDYYKWDEKTKKRAALYFPKTDWVKELALKELAKEREESIDLDIGIKERREPMRDEKGNLIQKPQYDENGKRIKYPAEDQFYYRTIFEVDASDDIKQMVKDAVGEDIYNNLLYRPFSEWTTEEMESLAQRVDRLYKEGRDLYAAKKQQKKEDAIAVRKAIEKAVKDPGIYISDDDDDETKQKKQEKINKVLGINKNLKGTQADKEAGPLVKINRLLHGYNDATVLRVARILDGLKDGTNVYQLYRREDEAYKAKMDAIDARVAKVQSLTKDTVTTEELAKVYTIDGHDYTLDEILYFAAANADYEVREGKPDEFFPTNDEEMNKILKDLAENDDYAPTSRNAVMFGTLFSGTEDAEYKQKLAEEDAEMQKRIEDDKLTADERNAQALGMLVTKPGTKTYIQACKIRYAKLLRTVNDLAPKYKALLDAIQADYAEQYDKMNKVSIEYFNSPVHRVKNYVPMVRLESNGDTNVNQVKEDLLAAYGGTSGKQWVNKGMTQRRVSIGPLNQKPVQTGLYKTWLNSMDRTEHFIAYAPLVDDLNRIYKSRDAQYTRNYIENRYGKGMIKYIDDYINELANPNANKVRESGSELMHILRGKTAPAYLAWKASAIIKQGATSPFPYMQFITPMEYLSASGKIIASKGKIYDAIKEKSTFMKHRVMDPMNDLIDEMAEKQTGNRLTKKLNGFNKKGMAGLEWIDWVCVAPGWYGCYLKEYARIEAQNKTVYEDTKAKLTEENLNADFGTSQWKSQEQIESLARKAMVQDVEAAAVQYADDCTRQCQPSNRKTDISPLFKNSGEFAKAYLQFQTSLNVIWNNLRYDIPFAVKSKQFARITGTILGYTIAGIFMNSLMEGYDTDDDDDKTKALRQGVYYATTQFTDAVPMFGSELTNTMDKLITGQSMYRSGTDMTPTLTKFLGILTNAKSGNWGKAAEMTAEGIGMYLGLPVSGIKELGKMAGIGDDDGKLDLNLSSVYGITKPVEDAIKE